MHAIFQVQNPEEFQKMIDNRDYRISRAIVDQILNNLNNKRTKLHLFSVSYKNPPFIYDYCVHNEDYIDTLTKNMEILKENEDYETCAKIQDALNTLNK